MRAFLINQLGKITNIRILFVVLLFIISVSWIADGFIGCVGILLDNWHEGIGSFVFAIISGFLNWMFFKFSKSRERNLLISGIISAVLSLVMVPILYKFVFKWNTANILPAIQLTLSVGIFSVAYFYIRELKDINLSVKRVEPKDIKGLVMFLSYWENIPGFLCKKLCELKNLQDFYKYLESNKIRCPWEMQMQLIEKIENDENNLEFIYVIGSERDKSGKSSYEEISLFKIIVNHFFPNIEIIRHPKPIDFEELEENINALKEAFGKLRERGLKDRQIIIDTTGGQKIQSIAGAFYSSTYDRYFAYVSTNDPKDVKVFDVIMGEGET